MMELGSAIDAEMKAKMNDLELQCHCGESGYYHCFELREKWHEMSKLIKIIIESDALKDFAYERGDDALSIRELCDVALRFDSSSDSD